MRHIESIIQKTCVGILRMWCPDIVVHHSPNEGKRSMFQHQLLKSEGMRKGFPDLELFYNGKAYFVEFKTETGRLSKEQKEVRDDLERNGFDYAVIRSTDEFLDQLNEWKLLYYKNGIISRR